MRTTLKDFSRKSNPFSLKATPSKVKSVSKGQVPKITKVAPPGRVLKEAPRKLLFGSGAKNVFYDVTMHCDYVGGQLAYKSVTKMMCESGKSQFLNFIMMDSVISNKETINLRSLLRFKKKERGTYASFIPDDEYYPIVQTIPEKCSFIIESAAQTWQTLAALILAVLLL